MVLVPVIYRFSNEDFALQDSQRVETDFDLYLWSIPFQFFETFKIFFLTKSLVGMGKNFELKKLYLVGLLSNIDVFFVLKTGLYELNNFTIFTRFFTVLH